jgi:acylphosphatase
VLQAFSVIATGEVQGVGFRKTVRDLAHQSGLVGSVANLPDGSVKIIVQGEDSKIDTFLGSIRLLLPPVKIADLQKSDHGINHKLESFKIEYGDVGQELEESLSAGLGQLKILTGEITDFKQKTAADFAVLNSKYDSISRTLAVVVQQNAESSKEMKRAIDSLVESMQTLTTAAQKYFVDRSKLKK